MSYFKKCSMVVLLLFAQSACAKQAPREGYITNYSCLQNGWRFLSYLSGNYNRKQDILNAIANNDKEEFKKKFMKGDLVDHPDIVIEIITQNKLELLKTLDEEFNLDLNAVVKHYHDQTNKPHYEFLHTLFAQHGSQAIEMKNFLKSRGFKIDLRDGNGHNVGHVALEKKDLELLQELLQKKDFDINAADKQEETVLHAATRNKDVKLFSSVINAQPELNQRNSQGETPFFIAASRDDFEKLELLSRAQADVNVPNNEGVTPGHLAAAGKCSIKSAKIIFSSRFDPKAQNNEGESVKGTLKQIKFRECIKNLEKVTDKKGFADYKKRCNHFLALESLFIDSRIRFLNEKTKKIKDEKNQLIEQELLSDKERLAQLEQQLTEELARIAVEKQKLEEQKKEKQAELKDFEELEEVLTQEISQQDENPCQQALIEEITKEEHKTDDPNQE